MFFLRLNKGHVMSAFSTPSKICAIGGTYYDIGGTAIQAVSTTSPTLVTPNIGVATATSINGMTFSSDSTATTIMCRDASANTRANVFVPGVTSIVTAASTTTLTVASTQVQIFTGSTTQTLVLPAATTLATGHTYRVVNKSSGSVTVNANGGGLVTTVTAGVGASVTVTSVGTAAGTWVVDASIASAGDVVLANPQTFTGVNTFSNATAATSSTTGALVVTGGIGVAGSIVGSTSSKISIGSNAAAAASALLDLTSTSKGMLVPRMTTAQRNAISSPATSLLVYDTDLSTLFVYKTTSVINYLPSGTADSTITSTAAWFPYSTSCRSLGALGGMGTLATTNWSATPSGTVILDAPSASVYQLYNNNVVNGAGLIWTCPVTVPVGVYEIIYSGTYNTDRAIMDVSVSFDNGSIYTPVNTGNDHYRSAFMSAVFFVHRYAVCTAAGTMKVKFVANSKNASSSGYYVTVNGFNVNLL